jgi:arylsulfate sulfotransferase
MREIGSRGVDRQKRARQLRPAPSCLAGEARRRSSASSSLASSTKRPEGRLSFDLFTMWLLPSIMIFATGLAGGGVITPSAEAASAKPTGETVNPTGNPQVAQFSVSLPAGATAIVQFGPTTQYGLETSSLAAPPGGGRVNFLVAGMLANSTYHMRSLVSMADGSLLVGNDHSFTSGGLPLRRVPVVSVVQTGSPNPGIELLDLAPLASDQLHIVHTAATDLNGNLIWYYDPPQEAYPFPVKLLPNGHMLINVVPLTSNGFAGVREIDLAGKTINQLPVTELNSKLAAAGVPWRVGVIHHDFLTLANGHLILLVNYTKPFHNLPGFPGRTEMVVGDALVDLDASRKVAWTWSSFDFLDVNRHPLMFPDWTHANAVIYSPDDGDLIVSMRNQDWVIKIAYEDGHGDGHILWRLGPGGDFTLTAGGTEPTDWNYAQHYPTIVSPNSSGTFQLGLMDNGNGRVIDGVACGSPGAPKCYSRAIIFQLDENNLTAQLIWQDSPLPFSLCCGNTDVVSNGDIEFDLAFTLPGMVEEVTSQTPPSAVWQMTIAGQLPYRALRLPSLYPGVQWP